MRWVKALVLMGIGGAIYAVIELIWRGHTHWTMALLGGLLFVLIGAINEYIPWRIPLWRQGVIGALIVTWAELVAGLVLNVWLRLGIGQMIAFTERETLVSGTVNKYRAEFAFDDSWDGYTKTAVFRADSFGHITSREVLLAGDACQVPHECLIAGALLRVGVYGISGASPHQPSIPRSRSALHAVLSRLSPRRTRPQACISRSST